MAATLLPALLAAAPPPDGGLTVMSDEQYAAVYGRDRPRAAGLAAAVSSAALTAWAPQVHSAVTEVVGTVTITAHCERAAGNGRPDAVNET
ncbi:hypothetical protein AB0469_29090 [Streptomyces sp. NPDC093801]|uniref:hypothetical protein n=1 Tax=Streptomyces sp. NPDC093801 TaxID=3155203 RepID=UPI00344B7997